MGNTIHVGVQLQHRCTAVTVALAATGAFGLCALAGFSCSFVEVKVTTSPEDSVLVTSWGQEVALQETSLGVNCLFDLGNEYSDGGSGSDSSISTSFYDESDRMWNLSRIFFWVGLACGGLTTIWSWLLSTCIIPTPTRWRLLSVVAAVTAVLQVPIFLLLESDTCNYDINRQQCTLGAGAYLNVASIGLWIVLTFIMQCLHPPRWDDDFDQLGVWKTVTHVRPSVGSPSSVQVVKNNNNNNRGVGTAASGGCPTDGTSTEGGGEGMVPGVMMMSPSSSSGVEAPWPVSAGSIGEQELNADVEEGGIDMEDDAEIEYHSQQRQQQRRRLLPPPPKQVLRSTSLLDENANNDGDDDGRYGGLGDGGGSISRSSSSRFHGEEEEEEEGDEDDGMSTTDRVIFDGVNICQGFRIETSGGGRDSVKKKKNHHHHHHPNSTTAMKSRSSSNQAVGSSSGGGNNSSSGVSGGSSSDGVKVTCVYSDGTRYETRLPSCMVDMTGKVQSLCSIDENNSTIHGQDNGADGGKSNGLLGAVACAGNEEDDTMNVDYLTRRMRSDVAAAVAAAEDGIFGSMDDDGAPIETIEIDMSRRVKSTIGLTGINDDENNDRRGAANGHQSSVYQADDVSELTKGSGLTSGVSEILDSGTQQGTMSILEDLARTY